MVIEVKVLPDWGYSESLYLGAIIATLIIAVIAFVTLLKAEENRKREHRDKIRMEILNWAIEVNNFALKYRIEAIYVENRTKLKRWGDFLADQEKALLEHFEPFRSESVYMEEVSSILDEKIKNAVMRLRKSLQAQIRLLHRHRSEEDNRPDMEKGLDVARINNGIHNNAVKVIRTLAKANTEEL